MRKLPKTLLIKVLALVCVYFLIDYIISKSGGVVLSQKVINYIQYLKIIAQQYYLISVFSFFIFHFISSFFSIPGACTFLNIASGAIFGFFKGVTIVYLVTLVSALVGYFVGLGARKNKRVQFYLKRWTLRGRAINKLDPIYLILLRLSPLFPFGFLNLLMGFLGVPINIFFITTFIGVFFDVFLLNSIGAFWFQKDWNYLAPQHLKTIFFLLIFLFLVYSHVIQSLKLKDKV